MAHPLKRLKNWCPKDVDQKFYVGRATYLPCKYKDMISVFKGVQENFDEVNQRIIEDDFSKGMATPIWSCLESLVDGIQAWCTASNIRQFGKFTNMPKRTLFSDAVDSKSKNFKRMFDGCEGYCPPWPGICGTDSSHYLEDKGILHLLDAGVLQMSRSEKISLRQDLAFLRVAMYQVRNYRNESTVKNKQGKEIAIVPELTPRTMKEIIYPKFCNCLTIIKKSLVPQDLKTLVPQPLSKEQIQVQKAAKKQADKQKTKDDYTQAVVASDNPGKEISDLLANFPPQKQKEILEYLENGFSALTSNESAEPQEFTI